MTISFITETVLPIECLTTMGLSVKSKENAIGRFGTGLKMAFAVLARNDVPVTLAINGEVFKLGTITRIVRETSFEEVVLTSKDRTISLNISTNLGQNWQMWEAFREIAANTFDEGGAILYGDRKSGKTAIVVESELFRNYLDGHEKVFLRPFEAPIFSCEDFEIFEGNSSYIYYQGLRANNANCAFTYNILTGDIRDDRTLRDLSQVANMISNNVGTKASEEVFDKLVCAKGIFESTFDWQEISSKNIKYLRDIIQKGLHPNANALMHLEDSDRIFVGEPSEKVFKKEIADFIKTVTGKSFEFEYRTGIPYVVRAKEKLYVPEEFANETELLIMELLSACIRDHWFVLRDLQDFFIKKFIEEYPHVQF